MFYDAQPAADDAEGQAILARFKGRAPADGRRGRDLDHRGEPAALAGLPQRRGRCAGHRAGRCRPSSPTIAAPNGKLAPNLAQAAACKLRRSVLADTTMLYFNMEDPIVGGYTPEQVALRRAVSLAYDVQREITLIRRGLGIPAQSPMVPFTDGLRPGLQERDERVRPGQGEAPCSTCTATSTATATAGASCPTASPLVLAYASQPEQIYREYNDLARRGLDGHRHARSTSRSQQWPAHLKQAQAGKLQMWSLGLSAADPDGQTALQYLYGPQAGQQNLARFKLAAMDELYERTASMVDGPEREKLFLEAKRLCTAYMPYRYIVHRLGTDVLHPWVHGYRRPVFWNNWYHMGRHRPRAARANLRPQAMRTAITRRTAGAALTVARGARRGRSRRPRRAAARSCATPSPSPRPASIRPSSSDLYSRTVTAPHLRVAVLLRLPGAADADPAADARGDARDRPTSSAPGPSASARASSSPTTRRSRASRASSSPPTTSTR